MSEQDASGGETIGELRLRKGIDGGSKEHGIVAEESTSDKVRRLNTESKKRESSKTRKTFGRTPDGTSTPIMPGYTAED